jgi:peptidoglycan/xylan/chitin deacetylase (PgdA/CDA1 family)
VTRRDGPGHAAPWEWPEERWRGVVDRVRAGRRLAVEWPRSAKVAVALSFDSDHETGALRDGLEHPGKLSQGEYGARVAVPKILELLDRQGVPATFFVPAVSALLHPGEVERYARQGHEVGVHGWIHEWNTALPRETEHDLAQRSVETLERLTGTRPAGIRTPSWDFSDATLDISLELGFLYDSSLMADDDPYEIVRDGQPTGMVEIPVEWIRDDVPYFGMERTSPLRPYISPVDVFDIWRREFEMAKAEGGLFQLTLHPHVIGHRSRLQLLDRFIRDLASDSQVWFATHRSVAEHCLAG